MIKFAADPASSPTAWSNARALEDRFADGKQLSAAFVGGSVSTLEVGKYFDALIKTNPARATSIANEFVTGVWDADNQAGRVGADRNMRRFEEAIPNHDGTNLRDYVRKAAGWPSERGPASDRIDTELFAKQLESGDRHRDPATWNAMPHQDLLDQYPSRRAAIGKDGVASPSEELIQPGLARTAPAVDHHKTGTTAGDLAAGKAIQPPSVETAAALGRIDRTHSPAERKAAVDEGADQLTLSGSDHAMVRNCVDYIEGLEQRRALGDLSRESISNLGYALNKSTSDLTKDEGLKADSALKGRAERAQSALDQISDRQRAEKEASLVTEERRQIAELETPAPGPRPTDPRFLAASDAITKGRFERVDNSPRGLDGFTFLRDASAQTDFSRVPRTIPAKRDDPVAEKEYLADGGVRFVKSNPARDRHRWTIEGHATSDRIAVLSPSGERWTFSRGTSGYEHLRRELYRATQGDPLDPTRLY